MIVLQIYGVQCFVCSGQTGHNHTVSLNFLVSDIRAKNNCLLLKVNILLSNIIVCELKLTYAN